MKCSHRKLSLAIGGPLGKCTDHSAHLVLTHFSRCGLDLVLSSGLTVRPYVSFYRWLVSYLYSSGRVLKVLEHHACSGLTFAPPQSLARFTVAAEHEVSHAPSGFVCFSLSPVLCTQCQGDTGKLMAHVGKLPGRKKTKTSHASTPFLLHASLC